MVALFCRKPFECPAALALFAQNVCKRRKQRLHLLTQHERWIDHDHAGPVEARFIGGRAQLETDVDHIGNTAFGKAYAESLNRVMVLDRVPDRIDAARPAPVCLFEFRDNSPELVLLLEGRVDQHHSTLFFRRQMRAQRQPAIKFDHPCLEIAGKNYLQPRSILWVQFDGGQTILLAQKMAHEARRAGIVQDIRTLILLMNRFQQGIQKLRCFLIEGSLDQSADPVAPFAGFLRLFRTQVVEADTRMRVDDTESLVLALQIFDDAGQDGVLDHIGEVSGMIGVAIVHVSNFSEACT